MIRTCMGSECSNICGNSTVTCVVPTEDSQAEQTLECNAAGAPNRALIVGNPAFCNYVASCPKKYGRLCICCKLRNGIRNIINLV